MYWDVMGCTWLLGCTGLHWVVMDCTGLYWAVMGFTRYLANTSGGVRGAVKNHPVENPNGIG